MSIPSNIAEGYERGSDAEIARFYIGIEAGFIEKQIEMTWADEAGQIGRMLDALINRHRVAKRQ